MNYLRPREIRDEQGQPTGRWHYTIRNDDRIWATGYCHDGCPGHETPDGAREHYKAYLLDHETRYDCEWAEAQFPCAICKAWTSKHVRIGGWSRWSLCDEHRNRETVERLLVVGDSAES